MRRWGAVGRGLAPALLLLAAMNPGKATVTIEGRTQPVRSAKFGIELGALGWDEAGQSWKGLDRASVSYWLEVEVDEHSGEDGAPAPLAQDIPVPRTKDGRHPSLDALAALTLREGEDDDWDAWFGNDAPGLFGNVLQFRGWEGFALRIHWEARYRDARQERALVFEGPAEFTGIHLSVVRGHDPDAYLKADWGGQPLETLERYRVGSRDYGARLPAERRYVDQYVYVRKGAPRPAHWTVGDRGTRRGVYSLVLRYIDPGRAGCQRPDLPWPSRPP